MNLESENCIVLRCVVPADLTSTTAPAFRSDVDQTIAKAVETNLGWTLLEIDLRSAKMVDSVGLNQLVSIIKTVRDKGSSVRILIGHNNIQRILAFTRIDKHAEVRLTDGLATS